MEQHKLVVFSVRWPKKKMKQRYVVIIFQGESLIYVRNLISRSLKHFPLPHTHTQTFSHVCLVYFYVKRIKKSFLEFRRHKLIFIYDPRISKSRWNGSTFLWDRQIDIWPPFAILPPLRVW